MTAKIQENLEGKQEHGSDEEFNNIVQELMTEDTTGYKEMMRMNYGDFCEILRKIEPLTLHRNYWVAQKL